MNIPRSSGHELACIKISYQLNHPHCIPSSHWEWQYSCAIIVAPPFFKMMLWPLAFNNWYRSSQTWRLTALQRRRTGRLLIPTKQSYRMSPKKLLAEPRCIVWNSTRENVAFISECALIVHCAALRKQAQWSVCAWKRKFRFNRFMLKIFSLCIWKIWENLFLKFHWKTKSATSFRSVAEPLRRCKNGEG